MAMSFLRKIYYKLFKVKPFQVVEVNDSGIPSLIYRDVGRQLNPLTVAYFALKYYGEGKKSLFLNCANWLVNNLYEKGLFSVWKYDFPERTYHLMPPWVGGMAQARGSQVLFLAHKITLNEKFMDAALRALQSLTIPIERGGVLYIDKEDGGWWYEEYASPNSLRSFVLNGHIDALEAVHEVYLHTKNNMALKIFNKGLEELKNHLHEYDTGSWTYYDRLGHIASWSYHNLHVEQMRSLWEITGDKFFLKYYSRWKAYVAKPSSKILYEWGLKSALTRFSR